jgi:hypothetical protein
LQEKGGNKMEEKSVVTIGNRFDELFLPTTKDDLFKLSKMYADSSLVPTCFRGKAADIVIAWSLGMPLGLNMMQCLLGIAVINGRPTLWGDVLNGLVLSQPDLEKFDEVFDDDNFSWTCTIKRKGRHEVTRTFSKDEAVAASLLPGKDGSSWKKYPKRMVQMRARGFCIRDSYSDVTSGLAIEPGELIDITDSAQVVNDDPKKKTIADKIAANAGKEPSVAPEEKIAPQQSGEPEPTPAPEYKDINDVISCFREAADQQTLKGMIGLIDSVEPEFKEEAQGIFSQLLSNFKSEPVQPVNNGAGCDELRRKLQTIAVGLEKSVKAEIAKELFGDGRKTSFRVLDLDELQLVKLEEIFGTRRLNQEDE